MAGNAAYGPRTFSPLHGRPARAASIHLQAEHPSKLLDEDQTIEFKGNTQLKLYKVEAAHAGALLGKFGGEPVT